MALACLTLPLNLFQTFALLSAGYYLKNNLFDPLNTLAERLTQLNALTETIEAKVARVTESIEFVKQASKEEILAKATGTLGRIKEALQSPQRRQPKEEI